MTAIYMDGFDHYGTGTQSITNMLAGSWANITNVSCLTPPWGAARTGQYCLRGNGFGTSGALKSVPTPGTHFFASFGFATDVLSTGIPRAIDFYNGSAVSLFFLQVTPTGAIELVKSSDLTVLGITSGPVVVPENWHFFEVEANTSSNTVTLRVDDPTGSGTAVLTVNNAAIAGTIAQIGFLTNAGGTVANVDDVFIRDAAGSVNNGFLGDRRVGTQLVDADTPTAGWFANRYTKLGAGILNLTSTTGNGAGVDTSHATSLDIGSGDFTLETFVRFQSLPTSSNKSVVFSRWDQAANQRSYEFFLGSQALNGGCLCWQTSTDGTSSTITQSIVYPWVPDLDTWYHLAIVRASGELLLFVNGQQFGLPIADSTTYFAGTSAFGLGGETGTSLPMPGTALTGWLDETRFTNGFARYTTNFTPTTVEFPRTSGGDPEWADVVLLAGYDTIIQDESGFARSLTAYNGAVQQTPNDGVSVGVWPVIGKSTPDDNTFIEAPFLPATSILTLTVNPSNGNTVTVGTTDGTTAAVYTFKTSLASAFDVLIDTSIQNTLQNLYNAINAGTGSGTKYGTGTTSNFDVFATQLPAGQMMVTANVPGTAGNSIASIKSGITGGWTSTVLAGGLDIPGPSNFKIQRLPPTTTIVSAIQISTRAYKTDAGVGSINTALVGALGGVATGSTHSLTVSPSVYNDIYETDPDTSGPISPTTLTNGAIQINRDT